MSVDSATFLVSICVSVKGRPNPTIIDRLPENALLDVLAKLRNGFGTPIIMLMGATPASAYIGPVSIIKGWRAIRTFRVRRCPVQGRRIAKAYASGRAHGQPSL